MVRNVLVTIAMLSFANFAASAQTMVTPPPIAQDLATRDQKQRGQICVSIRRNLEKITVGRGRKQIEITMGGGACEPPGSGISDLWVRYSMNDSLLDVVVAHDCPAYQAQITKLWSTKPHRSPRLRKTGDVRAGPYVITDGSDVFELKTKRGREAASRWISQTLAAVQPCWNTVRQDRTRQVVDSLYKTLSM